MREIPGTFRITRGVETRVHARRFPCAGNPRYIRSKENIKNNKINKINFRERKIESLWSYLNKNKTKLKKGVEADVIASPEIGDEKRINTANIQPALSVFLSLEKDIWERKNGNKIKKSNQRFVLYATPRLRHVPFLSFTINPPFKFVSENNKNYYFINFQGNSLFLSLGFNFFLYFLAWRARLFHFLILT